MRGRFERQVLSLQRRFRLRGGQACLPASLLDESYARVQVRPRRYLQLFARGHVHKADRPQTVRTTMHFPGLLRNRASLFLQMGTSMEDAFKHFDKDGCGSITAQGFSTGLQEMGVFQEFSQEEINQVSEGTGASIRDSGTSTRRYPTRAIVPSVAS